MTYIINSYSNVEVIEPQQTALAKLCSYCIYTWVKLQQNNKVKNYVHKQQTLWALYDVFNILVFSIYFI